MSKYTVEAERGTRRWVLQAVEAPGAISEVDSLSQVNDFMREAIHIVTGEPEDQIEIELVPVLPESTREHLRRESELREQAATANAQAAEEWRAAVVDLHNTGASMRDIGAVLGISHQRVHQLVTS